MEGKWTNKRHLPLLKSFSKKFPKTWKLFGFFSGDK